MFKIIKKPPVETSFRTINKFRIENKIKKIGHTGTLDPLAFGLLLVATNEWTKLIPLIEDKTKEYKVQLKLGYWSRTFDKEGPIEFYSDFVPNKKDAIDVINSFVGKQQQTPPIFSAKKINGKAAYKYARGDVEFALNPIEIEIYSIKNIEYEYPYISFTAFVSNGTYIRSLVNDIGIKLNTRAYMTSLERTMVNGLRENEEINIEKLLNAKKISIDKNDLEKILRNEYKFNNYLDGKYLLELNGKIVGYFIIRNNQKDKLKIFGNELKE